LDLWIREDRGAPVDFDFYHAPLGVDASVFQAPADPTAPRPFVVCTSGYRRNQEGVGECDDVAAALGREVLQLGPTFQMKAATTFVTGIEDAALAAAAPAAVRRDLRRPVTTRGTARPCRCTN
jgi:hypothetical protein